MKRRVTGWKADFPILEVVEDFAGKQRRFVINCHEGELGYTVRASEEGKDRMGYEFAAYSETSPYSALGRVRDKMSRGLATRHITTSDGLPLSIEEIEALLQSHEGWEFELRIVDALE